jgi:hypothetical protein
MNKALIQLMSKENIEVYYALRCDDKRSPTEVKHDMSFQLWEIEKVNNILSICEINNLKYDFVIQKWNSKTDSIEDEIYIVSTNSENNY